MNIEQIVKLLSSKSLEDVLIGWELIKDSLIDNDLRLEEQGIHIKLYPDNWLHITRPEGSIGINLNHHGYFYYSKTT